jgi:hypothetical protein
MTNPSFEDLSWIVDDAAAICECVTLGQDELVLSRRLGRLGRGRRPNRPEVKPFDACGVDFPALVP